MTTQRGVPSSTQMSFSLLDEILTETASAGAPAPAFLGECVDTARSGSEGRVLVRWIDAAGTVSERWLLVLRGVAPEIGDRVFGQQPENAAEPIVTGILGSARPANAARADEPIRITSADGTPVLEIRLVTGRPHVKLLSSSIHVEVSGALRLSADSIELSARQGDVRIGASADVVVVGETIRLN